MVKRIVVAGCRNFDDYAQAKEYIDFCIQNIRYKYTLIFLSGCCSGTDSLGERYAKEHNYSIEYHQAHWDKYGKAAGPIRNDEMARLCDYVICFWDGKSKGTLSMINCAKKYNKKINIKII